MNCQECETFLVAAVEGPLPLPERSALESHIFTCFACQDLAAVLGRSAPGLVTLDNLARARGEALDPSSVLARATGAGDSTAPSSSWLGTLKSAFESPSWAAATGVMAVVAFLGLQITGLAPTIMEPSTLDPSGFEVHREGSLTVAEETQRSLPGKNLVGNDSQKDLLAQGSVGGSVESVVSANSEPEAMRPDARTLNPKTKIVPSVSHLDERRSLVNTSPRMAQAPNAMGPQAPVALGRQGGENPEQGGNEQPLISDVPNSPLKIFHNVIHPSLGERARIVLSGNGPVSVTIFNRLGEPVANIFNGQISKSLELHWSGQTNQGLLVPAGIYIAVAELENANYTAKIVVKK